MSFIIIDRTMHPRSFSFDVFDAEGGGSTPGERASKKLASPRRASRIWFSGAKFCIRKFCCFTQLKKLAHVSGAFGVLPVSIFWREASPYANYEYVKGSRAVQAKTSVD